MYKKSIISSSILLGCLISSPALAYFWSDFGITPPGSSNPSSVVSAEGWPDWIGRLNDDLPPSIVKAGDDLDDWPSWIGRINN